MEQGAVAFAGAVQDIRGGFNQKRLQSRHGEAPEDGATDDSGADAAVGIALMIREAKTGARVVRVKFGVDDENRAASINYGLDKVRFPAPVPVGSRLRMSATLAEATDVDSGVQVKIDCVLQVEGQERPACVARAVVRHHF